MQSLSLSPRRRLAAVFIAVAALAAVAGPVAAQDQPIDPVPVTDNIYALEFVSYGGSGISGVGHFHAPTAPTSPGPSVAIELGGATQGSDYRVRLGGVVGEQSTCDMEPAALVEFNGDAEWTADGAYTVLNAQGVIRWSYDPLPAFTGAPATSLNAAEPVVLVTEDDGTIVSCAELTNPIAGPNIRTFPVARVGGASPTNLNNSGIKVSGQVSHLGTLLTYDITFTGANLLDGQKHILYLRSVDDCPTTPEAALNNAVAAITFLGQSSAPPSAYNGSDLNRVYNNSYSTTSGNTLRVQGSTVVPNVSQTAIGEYGLVLLGLENGSTTRSADYNNFQIREVTPSVCVALVDSAGEVGPAAPTTVAEAKTLDQLINATDFRPEEDAELLRLYQAFFNREPDLGGAQYWLQVSRNGRKTINIAGDFTIASAEFQNFYADAPDNRAFLERVYDNMLGRQPDVAGFNYWLDRVNGNNANGTNPKLGKLSRGQTVFYVALNQEFINRYPFQPS